MALVDCDECKRKISERAIFCPRCGAVRGSAPASPRPPADAAADKAAKAPEVTEGAERWLQVWMKVEDVAMHFNDLMLNFRLKAVGALSLAAGVVASLLATKENIPFSLRLRVLAAVLAFLGVLWLAIWLLDHRYYQRLLRGAVKEAKRLEQQSGGALDLSGAIEREVNDGDIHFLRRPGRWGFYLIPLLGLCGFSAGSWRSASLKGIDDGTFSLSSPPPEETMRTAIGTLDAGAVVLVTQKTELLVVEVPDGGPDVAPRVLPRLPAVPADGGQ